MYWNDEAVYYTGETMPNGEEPLMSSGADGVSSGNYDDAPIPNRNSRAWGNFTVDGDRAPSKGEATYLDTFTWLEQTTSASLDVEVLDSSADSDGDGFTDIEELCKEGTDPNGLAGYYHGGCDATGGAMGAVATAVAGLAAAKRRRRA
jgi:uncharacterized protein (TIGR03382 family)